MAGLTERNDEAMAGMFELFTDGQEHIRFRLLGPDGAELALSQAFEDKAAAMAAINAVRECAGTGLIQDHCLENRAPAPLPQPAQPRWRPAPCLAKPARRTGTASALRTGAKATAGTPGSPHMSDTPGANRSPADGPNHLQRG